MSTNIHLRTTIRTILRSVVRSSAPRPLAAQQAAAELRRGLWAAVLAEIRWAFTPPRAWLSGVAVNLVLSALWLLVQPVRHEGHRDWVVLVGTYFSSFILADVTTTNVLGIDNIRVEASLEAGTRVRHVLLTKNLALLAIVGVPTLAAAVVLTLWLETPSRLAVTVPNVALPILSWLGVGNLVSAVLPVGYEPLIRRWRRRHDLVRTLRWLVHLALPYALFYLVDPVYGAPRQIFLRQLPAALGAGLGPDARALVHIGAGVVVWCAGIVGAEILIRIRGLRLD